MMFYIKKKLFGVGIWNILDAMEEKLQQGWSLFASRKRLSLSQVKFLAVKSDSTLLYFGNGWSDRKSEHTTVFVMKFYVYTNLFHVKIRNIRGAMAEIEQKV